MVEICQARLAARVRKGWWYKVDSVFQKIPYSSFGEETIKVQGCQVIVDTKIRRNGSGHDYVKGAGNRAQSIDIHIKSCRVAKDTRNMMPTPIIDDRYYEIELTYSIKNQLSVSAIYVVFENSKIGGTDTRRVPNV